MSYDTTLRLSRRVMTTMKMTMMTTMTTMTTTPMMVAVVVVRQPEGLVRLEGAAVAIQVEGLLDLLERAISHMPHRMKTMEHPLHRDRLEATEDNPHPMNMIALALLAPPVATLPYHHTHIHTHSHTHTHSRIHTLHQIHTHNHMTLDCTHCISCMTICLGHIMSTRRLNELFQFV